MKNELWKKDYLEVMDMKDDELKKYSKDELIKLIGTLAMELYDMEKEKA